MATGGWGFSIPQTPHGFSDTGSGLLTFNGSGSAATSGGGGSRSPSYTSPFSNDSMWNAGIADLLARGAYYGRGGDGGAGLFPGFTPLPSNFGQGWGIDYVFLYDGGASGTYSGTLWYDPPWPARDPSGPGSSGSHSSTGRTIHLPNGTFVPAGTGVHDFNAAWGYYDRANDTWWQGNGWDVSPAGSTTPAIATCYLTEASCADELNTHRGVLGGHGATLLGTVGGVLRTGELESTVTFPQHMLNLTFPLGMYARRDVPFAPSNAIASGWSGTSGGTGETGGFVYPAISQDSGATSGSFGVGNFYGGLEHGTPWLWAGSIIAVRPQDLATVMANLPHKTIQGKNFANTMCTFGAICSENAASAPTYITMGLQADQGATATIPLQGGGLGYDQNVADDLDYVFSKCYVVMNANPLPPN